MAFCFESLIMPKETIKKLLQIADKTLVEHFFSYWFIKNCLVFKL